MEAWDGRLRDAALHLLEHGAEEHAHRGGEDLCIIERLMDVKRGKDNEPRV